MFERNKKDHTDMNTEFLSSEDRHNDGIAAKRDATRSTAETSRRDATVIGRSIRFNGDLQGDEDVRIEGEVTGTIRLINNTLTVGSEGKIHADVYAKSVTVAGVMEGDLYGSERVNIGKQAQVRGNITAPRVSLEDGARFKGSIEMDPEAAEAAVGTGDVTESPAETDEQTKISTKQKQFNTSRQNGDKPVSKPKTATEKDLDKRESAAG